MLTSKVRPKSNLKKKDFPVGAKNSKSKDGVKPSKVVAKRLNKESKLLDPVEISNIISPSNNPNIVYTNPTTEIDFSHSYISDDLNRFNVAIGACENCCPMVKHFSDSKSAVEKVIQKDIIFIRDEKAIFMDPAPCKLIPLFDLSQIG